MALFMHEVRLLDRFVCPTPSAAAPCNRRSQLLPPGEAGHTPHVEVDLRLCTSGTYVDRAATNGYEGHVPDAPVMVGTQQRAAYRRGMLATSATSANRWLAVAGAGAVGAALGVAVAVSASVSAALLGFAVGSVALAAAVAGAVGLAVFVAIEWCDWAGLHRRLTLLEQLSRAVEREVGDAEGSYVLGAVDEQALNRAMDGDDWALQQAALELSNPFAASARAKQRALDAA